MSKKYFTINNEQDVKLVKEILNEESIDYDYYDSIDDLICFQQLDDYITNLENDCDDQDMVISYIETIEDNREEITKQLKDNIDKIINIEVIDQIINSVFINK